MKNIRLFELESDYLMEEASLEYPTVSYCKESDEVKYKKQIKIINFTVTSSWDNYVWNLQAEEGMTWYEWVQSDYNLYNWTCERENEGYSVDIFNIEGNWSWAYENIENVYGNDVILSENYGTMYEIAPTLDTTQITRP